MAKKKNGITLEGFDELIAKLDSLNGNVKRAVTDCLQQSQEVISEKLETDMKKHKRTGDTARAIVKNTPVKWSGTKASVDVGFRFAEGLPSVFLMYGTPRMKKDSKLYADVYGKKTRDEIARMQALIIADEIHNAMKG